MRWGEVAVRAAGAVAMAAGAVAMAAGVAFVVVLLNLFLTLAAWKSALAFDVVAVLAAPWLWSRASGAWLARGAVAGLALAALSVTLVVRPSWVSHSQHDARLAQMTDELCGVDLPASADMGRCGGSITNTGNGNSCRYLVTATVETRDPAELEAALRRQGFGPTTTDYGGYPQGDGMTYEPAGDRYKLWLQSSYQPSDHDLRCT